MGIKQKLSFIVRLYLLIIHCSCHCVLYHKICSSTLRNYGNAFWTSMDVPNNTSRSLRPLSRDVVDERREKGNRSSSTSLRVSYPYLLFRFLFLLLCILPSAHSQCERKPVIFNFGDSNADTGGFSAESGIVFKPPFGRAFFHEQNGRISDGRLTIDFFCEMQPRCLVSLTQSIKLCISVLPTLPFNAFTPLSILCPWYIR